MAYAALALAERFASSKPIKRELDNLRSLAAGDQLLEAAASSIPEAAAKKGIPTLEQLRARCEKGGRMGGGWHDLEGSTLPTNHH